MISLDKIEKMSDRDLKRLYRELLDIELYAMMRTTGTLERNKAEALAALPLVRMEYNRRREST